MCLCPYFHCWLINSLSISHFQILKAIDISSPIDGTLQCRKRVASFSSHSAIHPFFPFFFFFLFRATPRAYGSSLAWGWIGATVANLCHSHSNSGSEPCLRPTSQLMAMPDHLTHWARPGIEPASSWIPVGLVTTEPRQELLHPPFLLTLCCLLVLSFLPMRTQSLDYISTSRDAGKCNLPVCAGGKGNSLHEQLVGL